MGRRGAKDSSKHLRVDFHGYSRQQAIAELERLVDRALLNDTPCIEIIHGLGTGTLKSEIHKYLAQSRHIRAFKLDEQNPGVTWVYF